MPVHVGSSLDDALTPILYALKAGIFRKNGLDVTLTSAQNGAALAAAVAGGAVDIAKSALMSLINAHLRGVSFKLVAGAGLYVRGETDDELCVLRNSSIASLADVVNKTVVLDSLQSVDQMATEALIDQHGGNSGSCRYIELPDGAMLEALESGRADVASMVNPTLQAVLESGKVRSFGNPYDAIGPRFLIAAWFCTEQFAQRNAVVAQRFAAAVREATIYTNAHHAETVPIVAAYTGISPDVLSKMRSDLNAEVLDPREIQPVIDAAYRYKFIPTTFDAKDLIATFNA